MEQNAPPPLVSGIPAGYEAVQEGLATILVPKGSAEPHSAERDATPDQTVFYNPIQQFNRDISVLVINEFAKEAVAAKTRDTAKRKAKARRADARKRRKLDGSGDATAAALPEKAAGSVEGRVKEEARGEEEEGGLSNDMPRQHTQQAAGVSGSAKPQNRERNTGGTSNDNTLAQHAPAPTLPPPRVPFTILDALAATGLRAIRYAKEIPLATAITANDLSPTATAAIRLNLQHNGLAASPASSSPSSSSSSSSSSAASTPVRVHTGNALALMYAAPYAQPPAPQRFDVIDLDPYGTAAPFFDAAVQALADGGLLCATCTDPGVFASAGFPEKAVALYGGVPVKGFYSHEAGLRLILHAIAASAARYGLAVEPLLALSVDYYARVFVRVRRSPATVKCLAGRTMLVYCCDQGCGAWATQPLLVNRAYHSRSGDTLFKHSLAQAPTATDRCEHCGSKTHLAGPMYAGPIHSSPFLRKLLHQLPTLSASTYGTLKRIEGVLTTALEEDISLAYDKQRSSSPSPSRSSSSRPHRHVKRRLSSTNDDDDEDVKVGIINGGGSSSHDPSSSSLGSSHGATGPGQPNTSNATTTTTTTTTTNDLAAHAHPDPAPFFVQPHALAKVLHCVTPTEPALRGALRRLGFAAARSHARAGSVKTDAPWAVLWEVMRQWVRQRAPVKPGRLRAGSPGWRILRRAPLTWEEVRGEGDGGGGGGGGGDGSGGGGGGAAAAATGVGDNAGANAAAAATAAAAGSSTPTTAVNNNNDDANTAQDDKGTTNDKAENTVDNHDDGKEEEEKEKEEEEEDNNQASNSGNSGNSSVESDNLRKGPLKVVFDEALGSDKGMRRTMMAMMDGGRKDAAGAAGAAAATAGGSSSKAAGKRIVRYQVNPRANWGPISRAKAPPPPPPPAPAPALAPAPAPATTSAPATTFAPVPAPEASTAPPAQQP